MPFPHLSHHFFIFPRFLWLNLPKMPLQHRLQPGQIEQDENARSFSPFPLRILQHRGPCKLAGGGRVPGAAPPREGVAALLLAAGLAVLSEGGGACRAGLAVALAAVVAVNAHDLVDWRVGLARYDAMAPASSSPSQKTPLICSSHTSSCTQPYLLSLYFLSPPSLCLCQSAAYRRLAAWPAPNPRPILHSKPHATA